MKVETWAEVLPIHAAKAFSSWDQESQARFFDLLAKESAAWDTTRVFQWQRLVDELWGKDNASKYADALVLIEEWVEYFGSKIDDPGNFWQGEAQRIGDINNDLRDVLGQMENCNRKLREQLRNVEREIAELHESYKDPAETIGQLEVRNRELASLVTQLRNEADGA